MSDPRMLDLLMRCQNGDATCLFVLHEIERQDNEFRDEIAAKLLKLCHAIEELPAGEKQTAVSIMASAIRTEVIGCVDACRPQPATSAVNAAREIPQWAKNAAVEFYSAVLGKPDSNSEICLELAEVFARHAAQHSQPYAGAGESELREVLEKLHRWCTENQLVLSREGITRSSIAEMVRAALTPRVASVGDADLVYDRLKCAYDDLCDRLATANRCADEIKKEMFEAQEGIATYKKRVEQLEDSESREIEQREIREDYLNRLTAEVLGEPIDWPDHQSKWQEAIDRAYSLAEVAALRSQLSSLRAENERLAKQLAWVDQPHTHTDTAAQVESRYRRFLLETASDHEEIEKLVAPFLTEHELHGDSYGVPTMVELVECVTKRLATEKELHESSQKDYRDLCDLLADIQPATCSAHVFFTAGRIRQALGPQDAQ